MDDIIETTPSVLRLTADKRISTAAAADYLAEERITQVGNTQIWLPTH